MKAIKWLLLLPFRIIKALLLFPFKIIKALLFFPFRVIGFIFGVSLNKCPSCKSTNIVKTGSDAFFKNIQTTYHSNGLCSFRGQAHRTIKYACKDCRVTFEKNKSTSIGGGGKGPVSPPSSFI